ncbi:inactive ubiquitin carboxyl-terminal hydrolase 50 [Pantherophis guttatus]|uniref:Ubiquitin carboxyl-terminal hydrolase 50 n=1 Tax=Pantherophis guttatus TaxID=94885 RepID=A0A6P9DE34_PANGU|nr:inactive ubiquitin carboxyl-terminal hydrolase 50 [Pantherophis guttatus]XP_058012472.1 inactive ubiquitin carboxyl-terminal hydrolase 50 [Ahaetulla prasina]
MASRSTNMPEEFNIYYLLKGAFPWQTSEESMDVSRDDTNPQYQGLTGLRNLGNTCYMNAVIQCLCSVSPLVEYFLSGKYIASLDKENGEIATAFAYLMNDMWLGDFDCVSPEVFRLVIGERYPAFIKKTQQDAQEFLIYVLNELHEALKKTNKKKNQGSSSTAWESRSCLSDCSIITRLFEGHLSYDIMCLECQTTTYKTEIFTVLSLPIPYESECSLEECLDCFFQQDVLTWNNQINCSCCGIKTDAAVKASIAKSPKMVIFHLKRFDCQGSYKKKLKTDIYYPLNNLDLSPYIYPLFRKNPKYNLFAVVNHFGDLDGGHYTAFCRHTLSQNWYNFDDSQINEIPESSVQTSAAYLLFYSSQAFSAPVKNQNV